MGWEPVLFRTMRRALRPPLLAFLLLSPGFGGTHPLEGQAGVCPGGIVSEIFIDNHSIFDPASLPEDPWIRRAYRLTNRIHVRTRPRFIEREILVRRGECATPDLLRESARLLREFRFIASADVFSVPQADGTQHVVVETRDEWTTKLSAEVDFQDGMLRFGGAAITEENFLGRGITVGVHAVERDARRDAGVRLELPRVFGTGWGFEGSGGSTRVGTHGSLGIVHPFAGEVGTFAFRQGLSYRASLFPWVIPPDPEDPDARRHLALPLHVTRGEVSFARRFGTPGRLWILGGGFSGERIRTGAPERLEWILDRDFSRPLTPPDEWVGALAGQEVAREALRVHVLTGLRQFEFETRGSLDAVAGVQDIPVGREFLLAVAPSVLGTDPGDVHVRADLFAGRARRRWVGQFHASVEGRIPAARASSEHDRFPGASLTTGARLAPPEPNRPDGPARHVLGEVHGFLYWTPSETASLRQTVVLRGTLQGGRWNDEPFQLTLGGPDGVRSLREGEAPGELRILFTVEDRIRIPSPVPALFDLGLTGFADAGRILPGASPFARDSGWLGAVGGGLRIGFPAGSAAVIRLDLALPVGPGAGAREPVLILQAREWVGILGSFRSLSMDEARRTGIEPRFPGVGRAPILR
jgi:hypothetical protein